MQHHGSKKQIRECVASREPTYELVIFCQILINSRLFFCAKTQIISTVGVAFLFLTVNLIVIHELNKGHTFYNILGTNCRLFVCALG